MASMTPTLTAASALSGLTIVLLVALVAVWWRNYRQFRTPLTLGLVAFALVLAVENVVAIGFFLSSSMLYAASPAAQTAVLAMRALQFVAVAALTYVTMR
jgi:multisubunit Na+/H+ antiporter MnhF subunit